MDGDSVSTQEMDSYERERSITPKPRRRRRRSSSASSARSDSVDSKISGYYSKSKDSYESDNGEDQQEAAPVLPPDLEEEKGRMTVKISGSESKTFKTLAGGLYMSRKAVKDWILSLPRVDNVLSTPPVLQHKLKPEKPVVAEVSEKDLINLHDLLFAGLNMNQLAQQSNLTEPDRFKYMAHAMKLQSVAIMTVTGLRRTAITRSLRVEPMYKADLRPLDGKSRQTDEDEGDIHHLFPQDVEDGIRDELKQRRKRAEPSYGQRYNKSSNYGHRYNKSSSYGQRFNKSRRQYDDKRFKKRRTEKDL